MIAKTFIHADSADPLGGRERQICYLRSNSLKGNTGHDLVLLIESQEFRVPVDFARPLYSFDTLIIGDQRLERTDTEALNKLFQEMKTHPVIWSAIAGGIDFDYSKPEINPSSGKYDLINPIDRANIEAKIRQHYRNQARSEAKQNFVASALENAGLVLIISEDEFGIPVLVEKARAYPVNSEATVGFFMPPGNVTTLKVLKPEYLGVLSDLYNRLNTDFGTRVKVEAAK